MTAELRAVSGGAPPAGARQCRAFLCVRNEAERLPYLFSYYRALGVHWFFVVDNGSHDATLEFLAAQPDCSAFTTTAGFAAARYGMDWINALIERHGDGHWCLFIDADELLVYPHCETLTLPAFCEHLANRGDEGVYAFMLDMYSEGPVAEAACRPGQPFLEICSLFDSGYEFRTRPRLPFRPPPFPPLEVVGGPRLRLFYPEFRSAGALRTMLPRGLARLRRSRGGKALGLDRWLPRTTSPPLLSKVPLMLGAPGRRYVSNHRTTALRLSPVTGALLHCKFFADFHDRVATAVAQGQHFDGGSEYGRYAAALRVAPALRLADAGSRRYRSSVDLLARGLLRSSPELEALRSAREAAQPEDAGPPRQARLDAVG